MFMVSMVLIKNLDGTDTTYNVKGMYSVGATDSYLIVEDIKGIVRSFALESINYVYYVDLDFIKFKDEYDLRIDDMSILLYSKDDDINMLYTDFLSNNLNSDVVYDVEDFDLNLDDELLLTNDKTVTGCKSHCNCNKNGFNEEDYKKLAMLCDFFDFVKDTIYDDLEDYSDIDEYEDSF